MPTTTPFNNLITFSRGSNATVTGPNGLIQWAPNNLLTFSEQIDNAVWGKVNTSVYPNQDIRSGTLGPELVTNGDFNGGTTGWTAINATQAVVGGQLEVTQTAANARSETTFSTTVGRTYLVTAQARIGTASSVTVTAREGSGAFNQLATATISSASLSTVSFYFTATTTGSIVQLAVPNAAGVTGYFDNISTREVTPAAATAPDGTATADFILPNTSNANHFLGQSFSYVAGQPYTHTIYAKASGYSVLQIVLVSTSFGANIFVAYDLVNGVASNGGGGTGVSQSITPVGNGWYRCSVTATATVTAASTTQFRAMDVYTTADQAYAGNGTFGIFLWGAQLELGSTATTYNPTTVKNLISFSEAFDNAGWTKGNASIVTGAAANPINGLFTAQKLMENTANAQHLLSQNYVAGAGIYTYSIYVKAAERDIFGFNRTDIGGFSASYNLTTGTVRSISGFTNAQIVPVGGGWYRVSCMLTLAAGTTIGFGVQPYNAAGSPSYLGDGNSGVYIYGAQLSDSASLDPYVPAPGLTASSTAFYGPRFDYNPVTLQPRGILIEEQRTNRTLQSENFTVSPWDATIGGTSTRANGTNALGFTEGIITATSVGGGIRQQHPGLTSGQVYALSFYIQSTATAVNMLFENSTASFGAPHSVVINPSNGTVGALTGFTSASVQPFGPGYIYTLITAPAGGALLANIEWRILNNGDVIRLGRPQFEAGAFATSYIPTLASTVTRSADVATITGQNFAQWYRQDAGSFVAEWALANANTTGRYIVKAFSPSVAQGYGLWVNSNSIDTRAWIGATSITAGNASLTVANKASMSYRAGDNAASVNGAAAVTSSATGPTDATYLEIGSAGASYLNGHIRSIRFIPARAADFQLQALTELPLVPTLDLDFLNNLYEA